MDQRARLAFLKRELQEWEERRRGACWSLSKYNLYCSFEMDRELQLIKEEIALLESTPLEKGER